MYNWFTNLNKKNEKHGSWNSELMNVSVGPSPLYNSGDIERVRISLLISYILDGS
jgi:hypothetical protein